MKPPIDRILQVSPVPMIRLTLTLGPATTLDDVERLLVAARSCGMEHVCVLDGHLVAYGEAAAPYRVNGEEEFRRAD